MIRGNPVGCDLLLVLPQKGRGRVMPVLCQFMPDVGRHAVLQFVLHMGVERHGVVALRPEILGVVAASKLKTDEVVNFIMSRHSRHPAKILLEHQPLDGGGDMPDAAIQFVGVALLCDFLDGHVGKDGPRRQLGVGTDRVFGAQGQGGEEQQGDQESFSCEPDGRAARKGWQIKMAGLW